MKMLSTLASVCLAFGLLFSIVGPSARADGGAPNLAYVSGAANGIGVIDILQQKVISTISVDGDPHTIYLGLDGRFLYVTQPALGRVTMFATATRQAVCMANVPGQPSLLAFDPGTNVIYAAGNGEASVSALDATTCAVKYTIKTSSPVYGLQVALVGISGPGGGSGNQLWVADSTSVTIFDSRGKMLTRVSIPGRPRYLSIPTGITAYVTTQSGDVDAIDLATRRVTPPLITGGMFGPMDYDAFTDEVYVPDLEHNQIDVLTPIISASGKIPHEPERVIPLGVPPESIAITSDGQLGFVVLRGGDVAMFDLLGRQLINTIHVGGSPHFVITGLYPPLLGSSTPQQASTVGAITSVLAYILVVALILVPVLLLRRSKPKVK